MRLRNFLLLAAGVIALSVSFVVLAAFASAPSQAGEVRRPADYCDGTNHVYFVNTGSTNQSRAAIFVLTPATGDSSCVGAR